VVLLGTVDSVLRNDFPYGKNRLWLENQLLNNFNNIHILRLSSLIHKNIKKNILYDLKNKCFLDKINLNTRLQWYDLGNLKKDISHSIENNIQLKNLVSEEIYNYEIVDRFYPSLSLTSKEITNVEVLPWIYSKDEIFASMEKYFNE